MCVKHALRQGLSGMQQDLLVSNVSYQLHHGIRQLSHVKPVTKQIHIGMQLLKLVKNAII